MKKLFLLLFLIPNLVMGVQPINILGLGIVEFEDGMTLEEIEAAIENEILPYEKRKLSIETKCSIKSGKAANEFSAKKIYENCLKNNDYYIQQNPVDGRTYLNK